MIKIAKELLSLETPIGDEENGHLSDFIEGQGPLENWISVSHAARGKARPTMRSRRQSGRRGRHRCRAVARYPRRPLSRSRPVRAENLNPDILVMQPASQGVRHDASDLLNQARDRSILVQ